MDKKVIIIGATSGIGREVALIYIAKGWKVGVAGRREAELESLRSMAPQQVSAQVLDVTQPDAPEKLQALIEQVGGMDVFLLSSGIGKQNYALQPDIELATHVSCATPHWTEVRPPSYHQHIRYRSYDLNRKPSSLESVYSMH